MKRGRTLDLTGAQLVALADLMQGRRVATATARALVARGLARWETDRRGYGEGDVEVARATDAARLLLTRRVYLAPVDANGEAVSARYAVVEGSELIAYVYVYPEGREPLAPVESIGPRAVLSSTTNALPRWMREALESAAMNLAAERPGARKAIDVTDVVDRAREASTVKPR